MIDYELLNQSISGLDLIEELGIADFSILVTSRYEESKIKENCSRLGLKLIPKAMAGYVPVSIIDRKSICDGILIDDDALCGMSWSIFSKQNGKILNYFATSDDFFKSSHLYHQDCPIFIDSNLGFGIKGEEVAKSIFEAGFTHIYLSTGYHSSNFENMPWIKGIMGKSPELHLFK